VTWCHGAPGIALSRIRAYALLSEEVLKSEATRALATTRDLLDRMLDAPDGADFSLCHGAGGNAEVLLYSFEVFGPPAAEHLAAAGRVAAAGIERYGRPRQPWPSGIRGGRSPSLMLGLAGTGYLYLRLHDHRTPSVLILTPPGG
jgi:lantibiotic modifying enzyme